MSEYPKLTAEGNIDLQAGCYVRFVYGGDDNYNPHSHDYYEIFIVAKGTVPHMVNGTTQNLPEGSLVFIRPDDVHCQMCNDPDTAFINLTFTRETTKLLFSYLFENTQTESILSSPMPPVVFLDRTSRKKLVSQISELNTENLRDKTSLKVRLKTILVNIFSHFSDITAENTESDIPLWITHLTNEMERPENFTAGIGRMVELSGKTREHLSRSFKKHYGLTLTDYINGLRVNYASNLLLNTNKSIIDICFESGFQSMSYFYRVFRSKNGTTPKDFKPVHKTVTICSQIFN